MSNLPIPVLTPDQILEKAARPRIVVSVDPGMAGESSVIRLLCGHVQVSYAITRVKEGDVMYCPDCLRQAWEIVRQAREEVKKSRRLIS